MTSWRSTYLYSYNIIICIDSAGVAARCCIGGRLSGRRYASGSYNSRGKRRINTHILCTQEGRACYTMAQYIPRRNGHACTSPLAPPGGVIPPARAAQHLIRAADHPPYSCCIAALAPLFATTAPISLYYPPPPHEDRARILRASTRHSLPPPPPPTVVYIYTPSSSFVPRARNPTRPRVSFYLFVFIV